MDDPSLPRDVHEKALRGLDRLQRASLTARRLWKAAEPKLARETAEASLSASSATPTVAQQSTKWLDVACGSGRILRDVRRLASEAGRDVAVVSVDLSATAITSATGGSRSTTLGVVADARLLPFEDGTFDVASCTLFLHHLEEDDAVAVVREMARVARMVLIDDLRRTRTGHLLAHVAGRVFTRSPIVHVDGPLSVEGAFTSDEIRGIAAQAGLSGAAVSQQWPQRTLLRYVADPRPSATD